MSRKHEGVCAGKNCCFCCTKIENFGVVMGGNEILKSVDIHIHCGELTALIGPNGAGKSTLLKAVLGEIRHTGELKFMDAKGAHTGNPVIGYVPQHLNYDRSSPANVLDFFAACRSSLPVWFGHSRETRNRVSEALDRVKAGHLINRRLGALSGGELQRVLLALALDPIPDILLLDEPVSGIDRTGLDLFYHIVSDLRNNYDLTIILVSHDLALMAKHADRVVLLNRTVLSSGTPGEVFRSPVFEETFGVLPLTRENNGEEGRPSEAEGIGEVRE